MSLEKIVTSIGLDQVARDAYQQAKRVNGYADTAISDAEMARSGACKETASPMTRGIQRTVTRLGFIGLISVTEIHGLLGGPHYEHRYTTIGTEQTPLEDWYVVDGTWLQYADLSHPGMGTLPNVLVGTRAFAGERLQEYGKDERASDLYRADTLVGYDDLPPGFNPLAFKV